MKWTTQKDNRLTCFLRYGLRLKTIAKIFSTNEKNIRQRLAGKH